LRYEERLEDACAGTDFVQECATEREALKVALFARVDASLPPGVLLASSSSALTVTKCRRNADILSTSCSGTLSTRPISCRWSKLLGARRRPKTLLIARADFIARWANACSPHQGNLWAYR
jgi:3-hydroxyacyl-CoA dehydrogenase, NAD binding domain